jgi:hypothetical protein
MSGLRIRNKGMKYMLSGDACIAPEDLHNEITKLEIFLSLKLN